ncbi:MAG: energy transducer TonB [Candidatus Eremiobacteraeota bacterium]|nr:energy transducer TonB [Candidatus Eremiobacteraeota bacterium]
MPLLRVWHPIDAPALPAFVVHAAAAPSHTVERAAAAGGSWLTFVWLLGVALCLTRLAVSYIHIRRLVAGSSPAPSLGPEVRTSSELATPIATGFFSPTVLIPAGLATTLEHRDLEGIIRHERAHIRRCDIVGNLVQRLIEACLFFNPWVYIVGRQLVREREAACDDWAVHALHNPNGYASCLARLAGAAGASTPLLTPSAIGSKRMLVGRIARLLNGKAPQLKTNYLILIACIALFSVLGVLFQTSNGLASVSNIVADNAAKLPPNCYHDVTVRNAAPPDIAKSDYRANVTANALVDVAADGHPTNAKIVKSSGSPAIDRATINAAMASTYSPEVSACKPKAGEYLFHVETGPPGS